MITLTKNRILQKGDEYRHNGSWKPVPKEDFGLQIEFTKYSEVRRPSETSMGSGESSPSVPAAKAGRVESRPQSPPLKDTPAQINETARLVHAVSHLPTVVSKKAHAGKAGAKPHLPMPAPKRVAASPTPRTGLSKSRIEYPASAPDCIWIGRNGTFKQRGVLLQRKDDIIQIRPVGARGVGKNALIEIPASIAPQLLSTLNDLLT